MTLTATRIEPNENALRRIEFRRRLSRFGQTVTGTYRSETARVINQNLRRPHGVERAAFRLRIAMTPVP